jgi:hypothetical protein
MQLLHSEYRIVSQLNFPHKQSEQTENFLHHMCILAFDFNEITPSKLLRNNIKLKEKCCVVLVHTSNKVHRRNFSFYLSTKSKGVEHYFQYKSTPASIST